MLHLIWVYAFAGNDCHLRVEHGPDSPICGLVDGINYSWRPEPGRDYHQCPRCLDRIDRDKYSDIPIKSLEEQENQQREYLDWQSDLCQKHGHLLVNGLCLRCAFRDSVQLPLWEDGE